MSFRHVRNWTGHSTDPHDEQFGDIIEQASLETAEEYDTVMIGEPYDGGVIGRAGAREGPAAIRESLARTKTHHFDAGPVDSVADLGDIEIPGGESVSAVQQAVREAAESVYETDTVPVFLGGDGSLTYANVAPLLDPRADGGYVTDGGFGKDDDAVGDVEHFDPTGGTDEEESSDADAADTAEDNSKRAEEDDSEVEQADTDEADGDEIAEDADEADETEAVEEDNDEVADADEGENDSEAVEEDTDEVEEADTEPDQKDTDESAGDADQATEDESDQATEDEGSDSAEKTGGVETAETVETTSSVTETTESDRVGVISLDAHLDFRDIEGQPTSATPYRQLFDAGLDSLAVIGTRHFETTTADAEQLQDQSGAIITAEEVGDDPVDAAERALETVADADVVYLSVDMDVLDSAASPGVSTPTPGGITSRELFRIVRQLASEDRLAGVEIVETAPPLCPDGRTARAAARTVAHALSVQ